MKMLRMYLFLIPALLIFVVSNAFATNGMRLIGFGPVRIQWGRQA